MRQIYVFFIITINSFTIIGQHSKCIQVSYQQTTHFDYEYVENYELTITNQTTLYKEVDIVTSTDQKKKLTSNSGITDANIIGRKNTIPKFYYNHNKTLYFQDNFNGSILLVKDNDFQLQWKFGKETKRIGNYVCKKATTRFRGREYTAWYTNELPVFFGPWKFKNAPGLILEVYDKDRVFVIQATKVASSNNCDIQIRAKTLKKAMSLQDYFKEKDQILDQIFAQMSSKLPKGSKPIKRDKDCDDCTQSIEIFNEE